MARRAFAQRTVPPHDPDATTPHGAYHLELLLGDGQGGTRVGALKKRILALEAVAKDPEVGGRCDTSLGRGHSVIRVCLVRHSGRAASRTTAGCEWSRVRRWAP